MQEGDRDDFLNKLDFGGPGNERFGKKGLQMAKYLILNEADYEDYTDPNSCFGNKNKEVVLNNLAPHPRE
jgi:hypothetical protein